MQLVQSVSQLPPDARRGVISIGNFDGVHVGHAQLVSQLVAAAQSKSARGVVLTFQPHPAAILRPESAPIPLTTTQRRAELLGRLGVDYVVVLDCRSGLLELTAEEFFDQIIVQSLEARAIVEGPNFYFGKNRGGNPARLAELCSDHGIELEIVRPTADSVGMVSSTRVRQLIASGDVEAANRYLTAAYRISGRVSPGDGRGRVLGFPTANLADVPVLVPAEGVYAGVTRVCGECYRAAVHIGPNPTFAGTVAKVEIHLIDFQGDLYGSALQVDLLARVREIAAFSSPAELKDQLEKDVSRVREIVKLAG